MATIEKVKRKNGTAHRLRYRFQNQRFEEYFSSAIDKSIVMARKQEVESGIALHKAGIKTFCPKVSPSKDILLKDFATWYENQRHKEETTPAPKTLKRYCLAIRLFAIAIGKNIPLAEVNTNHIIQFKRHEKAKGKSERGINIDLKHLKHALNLARKHNLLNNDIEIEYYRTEKKLPTVLMPEEVSRLEELIMDGETRLAYNILKWTGIRRGELMRCKRSDFNFKENYLMIAGKNREQRTVPIHSKLKSYLQSNDIFSALQSEDPILKIHSDTLTHRLHAALKSLGKPNLGSSVHILRHSFGLFLINEGFDLREVQEMLGHKTLYMTTLYTQILKKRLAAKFNTIDYLPTNYPQL